MKFFEHYVFIELRTLYEYHKIWRCYFHLSMNFIHRSHVSCSCKNCSCWLVVSGRHRRNIHSVSSKECHVGGHEFFNRETFLYIISSSTLIANSFTPIFPLVSKLWVSLCITSIRFCCFLSKSDYRKSDIAL